MLAFLKKRNPYNQAARAVYALLLERVRSAVFYTEYGVPDTFDGRFDLLMLHLFMVVNRLADEGKDGRDFNQALFDAAFADMDQTLRERGIGDMGVPKHMRRMMRAFNGRVHAYSGAMNNDDALQEALMRNLYAGQGDASKIKHMQDYVQRSVAALERQKLGDLLSGAVIF